MPKYVLYCSQDAAPTVSVDGKLSCDGGTAALQVGLLETTLDTPDTSSVASVWTAGFSLVMVCFLIGRAIGALLQMIREG
ncbi:MULTISPECIES: hypothetical protein [Herbaspirillum]|uniref:hypothetical protein n=1 Tax=Herbaspirillum TaxID=963 RepID=UPI0005CA23DC|nr:hypothetical protein [Herbaspirillum sp. B65]MCP1573928.1 hypothetical protein [Herbaspirillum rubrisubalbicans]NQE48197.1 hypothetical protein [Herbaspirillum rubrisubalbicans]BEV16842.1 hypothetical protein HBDW_36300 [Herbaspirillum sp. DW155]